MVEFNKISSTDNNALELTITDDGFGINVKSFIENDMEITIYNRYNYPIIHTIVDDKLVIESNDILHLYTGHNVEIDKDTKLRVQSYDTTSHLVPIGVKLSKANDLYITLHNKSDKPIALENGVYLCTLELYSPINIIDL